MASVAPAIPASVYMLRKAANLSGEITKFVVCQRCHRVYRYSDSVTIFDEHQSSKNCSYVHFPDHPQERHRAECGCVLLKTVQLTSGRKILYPFKAFPYKTLLSSLQELLLPPGFAELYQQWILRTAPATFQDVYDGKIWKDFQVIDGAPFLSSVDTLLMINVDRFQPFKHSVYSVGVIYLTLMNLPRFIQFKRYNVIFVGILPGPSEPKHDFNAYIEPLVKELTDFWSGVSMKVHSTSGMSNRICQVCSALCSMRPSSRTEVVWISGTLSQAWLLQVS